jgi:LAO/AO transport system kinase
MTLAEQLVAGALARRPRDLSRLASHIENETATAAEAIGLLARHTGNAQIVGFTGPPGVGKSSLVAAVAAEFRRSGLRVAILAIDPSSPVSGGATLGDRVRMSDLSVDHDVFIRSLASRTSKHSVAPALDQMIDLFDAAGFEKVLVETVGSGQQQVEIVEFCDTVLLVQAPGAGDGVQLMKAGILELADIFVVNKADRPGATDLARDLRSALRHGQRSTDLESEVNWSSPVVLCSVTERQGMEELATVICDHFAAVRLRDTNGKRSVQRIEQRIVRTLLSDVEHVLSRQLKREISQVAGEIERGECDYGAAQAKLRSRLVAALSQENEVTD